MNIHSIIRHLARSQTLVAIAVVALMQMSACVFGSQPVLQTVEPNPVGTEVYVRFSEALCSSAQGVTRIANYSVSPPATITAATLLADLQTVRLDFAPSLLGGSYTLNITTPFGFEIFGGTCSNAMASPASQPFNVTGTLTGPVAYYTTPGKINVDCGSTVVVHGAGFDAGATLVLIPGSIAGSGPVVNSAGTEITATFPGGISPGNYSIVVKNPAGGSVFPGQNTAPYAIKVEAINVDSIWPSFVGGCDPVRVTAYGGGFCPNATMVATVTSGSGSPVTASAVVINPAGDQISGVFDFNGAVNNYNLTVQNPSGGHSTPINALLNVGNLYIWNPSPQFLGNCSTITFSLNGGFCAGDQIRLMPISTGTAINGTVTSISPSPYWQLLTADFNMVGAAPGYYLPEMKHGAGAWVSADAYSKIKVTDSSTCPIDVEIVGRTIVGYTRVNHYTINVRNLSCASTLASIMTVTFPVADNPAITAPTAGGIVLPANVITYNIPPLAAGAAYPIGFDLLLPNLNTTATLSVADSVSSCANVSQSISVVASQDPNFKEGLPGSGANHKIGGYEDLPYEIHFENISTASAPAQDVFINDRLNPAQFDLSTFSLGEIKFGNRVITPPPGLTSFSDIVPHDLDGNPATSGDQMLLVVDARLIANPTDPDYGRMTWSYRTLDPTTLDTPTDINLGFLPPNQLPPVGEGSVKFNVKLKPGVTPGAQFGSAAVIIFDSNAPIFTDPWFNQKATPVGLSVRQNLGQIEIEWTGVPGEWTLEETSLLGPAANWTPVSTSPVPVGGGLQRVTVSPPLEQQKYFRLRW